MELSVHAHRGDASAGNFLLRCICLLEGESAKEDGMEGGGGGCPAQSPNADEAEWLSCCSSVKASSVAVDGGEALTACPS